MVLTSKVLTKIIISRLVPEPLLTKVCGGLAQKSNSPFKLQTVDRRKLKIGGQTGDACFNDVHGRSD